MRKISPNKAHFFQPLLPNNLYNFSIPKSFLINLGDLQSKQEKKAELRDKKGQSWYVKLVMSSIGDKNSSRPHFTDGWERFCKDHDLQVGDFLVFKHQGNFVFDVFFFAPTACERQLPISNPTVLEKNVTNPNVNNSNVAKKVKGEEFKMGDEEDRMKGRTISTSKSSIYPSCRTVVKSYCLASKSIYLPKEFIENNGLSRRWCDMELIDEKGRSWTVHLRYRRERKSGRPYIGSWKRFHQANYLKNGDVVIFQLIDSGPKPVMKFYKI